MPSVEDRGHSTTSMYYYNANYEWRDSPEIRSQKSTKIPSLQVKPVTCKDLVVPETDSKLDRENCAVPHVELPEPAVVIENDVLSDISEESSICRKSNDSQFEFSAIEYAEFLGLEELEMNDFERVCNRTENCAREHNENNYTILQRVINLEMASSMNKDSERIREESEKALSNAVEKLRKRNSLVLKIVFVLCKEIQDYKREIKNLKWKTERFEADRSASRSRRSQYSRRKRSVSSRTSSTKTNRTSKCRSRSRSHSSSRKNIRSQNRSQRHERKERIEVNESSNHSSLSQSLRQEVPVSNETPSTDQMSERRTRSRSRSPSKGSIQSQNRSQSNERKERIEMNESSNHSSLSQSLRQEAPVSNETPSTDQMSERATRSQSHSPSRESIQSQNRSQSNERKERIEVNESSNHSSLLQSLRQEAPVSNETPSTDRMPERATRSQSHSPSRESIQSRERKKSLSRSRSPKYEPSSDSGLQIQLVQNSWRSCIGTQAPSPPIQWMRPRVQSRQAKANTSRLVDAPKTATSGKKPIQKRPSQGIDLQKFPYEEYELIGDSLSFYLANVVSNVTENLNKSYLKEQISLTNLYKSIEPVTFTKSKAIVSMAQYELNFCYLNSEKLRRMVEEIIDLLIEKGFEKIVILFPLIKPVVGNHKPVSTKRYYVYKRIFKSVCDPKKIPFWWTPAALFLQQNENEKHPESLKLAKDDDNNMIPMKCKFTHRESKGKLKFYPDLELKEEVLIEIDKLYNRKRQTMAAPQSKREIEAAKEKSKEISTSRDEKTCLDRKQVTCKTTKTELPVVRKAAGIEKSVKGVPDIQLRPEWYQKPGKTAGTKSATNPVTSVTDSSPG